MTKRYRLTDMELDEISLVPLGDDPEALLMIAKSASVVDDYDHDQIRARIAIAKMGKKCKKCGKKHKGSCGMMMSKMSDKMPDIGDDDEMGYKSKKRKKKRKDLAPK